MRVHILQEVRVAGKFPTVVRSPPKEGALRRQSRAIAVSHSPVYSLSIMTSSKRVSLLTLLAGILVLNVGVLLMGHGSATAVAQTWWGGFLVLMPICLGILVWRGLRWAAMASVIYGTVGLALDLATTVQILTKDPDVMLSLLNSLVSGFLNFLLIVFGGRSFLDVGQAPMPRESRPPSPPSAF
jgi:hypothetical protein